MGIPLRKGECSLHKCDNPACVNPEHLFIGTQLDNISDAVNKKRNRYPVGEKSSLSKLTSSQVEDIKLSLTGSYGEQSTIARKFGLSRWAIGSIKRGKTWKHISPPLK